MERIMLALDVLEQQDSQRFPYAPLAERMGVESRSGAADILGVSVDLIKRFEREGLSSEEADRLACRIHLHPLYVWDSWMNIEPIPDFLLEMVESFIVDKKKCAGCHQWKPKDEFFKRAKSKDGLGHKCKLCAVEYEAERKAKLVELSSGSKKSKRRSRKTEGTIRAGKNT